MFIQRKDFIPKAFGNVNVIFTAYLAVQVLIWIKALNYFLLYGKGAFSATLPFVLSGTAPFEVVAGYWFHEVMHVAIFVLAVWFGAKVKKLALQPFIFLVLSAVILHNWMYWLTNVFPTLGWIIWDFFKDFIILALVILASHYFFKFTKKAFK